VKNEEIGGSAGTEESLGRKIVEHVKEETGAKARLLRMKMDSDNIKKERGSDYEKETSRENDGRMSTKKLYSGE